MAKKPIPEIDKPAYDLLQSCIEQARLMDYTGEFQLTFFCHAGWVNDASSVWHQKGLLTKARKKAQKDAEDKLVEDFHKMK